MKTSKAIDLIDEIRLTHNICSESNSENIISVFARSQYIHGKLYPRSRVSIVHDRCTGKTRLHVDGRPVTVSDFNSHLSQIAIDLKEGFLELPKF